MTTKSLLRIIDKQWPVSADDYYTAYNLLGIRAIVDHLSK